MSNVSASTETNRIKFELEIFLYQEIMDTLVLRYAIVVGCHLVHLVLVNKKEFTKLCLA